MQRSDTAASNPLSRIALAAPPVLGTALSTGARLIGAALAAYIANDQPYDRTQVFATGVAAFALLSLVPAPAVARVTLSSLASGALFFTGALLLDQSAGIAMLLAGAVAVLGGLMANHRAGGNPTAPLGGFFFGLGLTVIWVGVVILSVEG